MSDEYESERMHGNRWGKAGAGLLLTTGSRMFLCLRSGDVLEPYTWGIAGGAIHPSLMRRSDAVERTVENEAGEELGPDVPPWVEIGRTVFEEGSFRYTTVIGKVSEEAARRFRPRLNWESDDARWFTEVEVDELLNAEELHFGVVYTLSQARGLIFGRGGSRSVGKPSLKALLAGRGLR